MNNIFEKASRAKLRFQTSRGHLSVEQLWDLPLEKGDVSLYTIAQTTLAEVDTTPAEKLSFFKKATTTDETALLKFEIVKHIVSVRVAEIEDKQSAEVSKTKKQELAAIIAAKKAEAMQNLSIKELEEMMSTL